MLLANGDDQSAESSVPGCLGLSQGDTRDTQFFADRPDLPLTNYYPKVLHTDHD